MPARVDSAAALLLVRSRLLSCLRHVASRPAIVRPRVKSENGLRPLTYNSHVNLKYTCKTGLVCSKHTRHTHLWLVCPKSETIVVCRETCPFKGRYRESLLPPSSSHPCNVCDGRVAPVSSGMRDTSPLHHGRLLPSPAGAGVFVCRWGTVLEYC